MSEQLRLGEWALPDEEATPHRDPRVYQREPEPRVRNRRRAMDTSRPPPLTAEQRQARTIREIMKIRERWYGSFSVAAPAYGDDEAKRMADQRVREILQARSDAATGGPRPAAQALDLGQLRPRGVW